MNSIWNLQLVQSAVAWEVLGAQRMVYITPLPWAVIAASLLLGTVQGVVILFKALHGIVQVTCMTV